MPVKVYCELWGAQSSTTLALKVFCKAPKGYRISSIETQNDAFVSTTHTVTIHNAVKRGYDVDSAVESVCSTITVHVEKIVDGPLGIVIMSDRLGIVRATCGAFVSYREVVDYVNEYEMDPVFSHEEIRGYLCSENEAEEALALLCQEDTEFDIVSIKSAAPLCCKTMWR